MVKKQRVQLCSRFQTTTGSCVRMIVICYLEGEGFHLPPIGQFAIEDSSLLLITHLQHLALAFVIKTML